MCGRLKTLARSLVSCEGKAMIGDIAYVDVGNHVFG